MGMVQHIGKSRKEYKCGKCRKTIPAGTAYYKGQIRFLPPMIRCTTCGLKWYEVTTSDYIRNVGRIVEDWQEDFTVEDGVWEEIASVLEESLDESRERLENMPDHLQEDSESGQLLQERIDALEAATDELQTCNMEDFLMQGLDALSEEEQEQLAQDRDMNSTEDWYLDFFKEGSELAQKWQEATEEAMCDTINSILEDLPL